MKFVLDHWYLVLAALVSGGMLLWPSLARHRGGHKVGTAEAVRLINREKAVLIDVSEPADFAAGHATQARHVPLDKLEGAKALPHNKALPVLVMCPNGTRAQHAVTTLHKLGYANSHVVAGGLAAWREAQLPVERSAA